MSTRARRARGRPPKTPVSINRSNFLRKPKAYQNLEQNSNVNNVGSSPLPHYKPGRGGRGRAAAHKSRQFLSQLTAEDDDLSSLPEFENDRTSDFTDDIDSHNADGNGSDVTFDTDEEDDLSENESLSTVSSSISKKRLLLKRPKTPEIQDDKDIPNLDLPSSATDLLLPAEHVLQAIGIYEVLRHFRIILRLSPFTFEDFCAALLSDEQSSLLAELHITLLKALLREDDSSSTSFGPQDTKDSVNVSLFFLDSMTWPEILRGFLDSENHPEYRRNLSVVESPNYPFVPYAEKMKVLQTLTDLFLATTKVREEIINEGNIHYDDHCRACHKLGDLLCCETCSAVYHLACVEPPMQEVPDDDWLCSVCRAHQVKGVTDCVSEAEKSGLLSRQEPIGYDRHARKYWFLCRRIIVEGEKETWYYSTKYHLEELLEHLDSAWEADLITFLSELKDDIIKQMALTEDLTNSTKGNKKSVLDIENAHLIKVQAERAQEKAREEEEKKAREEEERKRKEREEEEKRMEEEKQNEKETDAEGDKDDETEAMHTDEDVLEEVTETDSQAVVTSQKQDISSSVKRSDSGEVTTETTETVTTTTTITTVTSTSVKTVTSAKSSGDVEDEDEPAPKKAKLDDSKTEAEDEQSAHSSGSDDKDVKSDGCETKTNDNTIVVSTSSALAEAIKSTSEGKPKVISLQSLLPAARQGLLNAVEKNGDDSKSDGQTKTVLLVNREGDKVTLQVQRQPVNKDDDKGSKTTQSSSTSVSTSAIESRKMLTRSKTGSLTPKLFTDSITMTTTTTKAAGKSTEEVVAGETTKTSRSKVAVATSISQQSLYFKLGSDGSYKQFQNQYTTNTLALNKHQHNEERDKRRHLSHKFSLTQTFDFKWNGNVLGNKPCILATLRLTITALEGNIQAPFMHSNWPAHKQQWQKAVQMSQTPRDFALALSVLEACVKPCVFNPVWHEALGHVRLNRITVSDREEWKKKEKEQRKRREDEDDVRPVVWIKYTLGLKHQIWKLKGEEYRVTGGNGWQWISSTWRHREVPQGTVGLRGVAQKVKERRVKAARMTSTENDFKVDETMEASDKDDEAGETILSENHDIEMADSSNKDECVNNLNSDSKDDLKMTTMNSEDKENSSLKVEKMDITEEDENVKSETTQSQTNQGISKEKANVQNNGSVSVKVESGESVTQEYKVEKKKSAKQTRLDGYFQDFISFMKNKYQEDKDNVFALELLKKHPPKADVDVINVSDALQRRTYYPKATKPYAKLDNLLDRRLRQDEFERKQRLTIETQIALKLKLNQAIETAKRKREEKERKREAEQAKLLNGDLSTEKEPSPAPPAKEPTASSTLPYSCYSICHRKDVKMLCYSPLCMKHNSTKTTLNDSKSSAVVKDNKGNISEVSTTNQINNENTSEEPVQTSNSAVTGESTASAEKPDHVVEDESNKKADHEGESNTKTDHEEEPTGQKHDESIVASSTSHADSIATSEEKETKDSQTVKKLNTSTEDEDVDIEGDKETNLPCNQPSSSGDKKPGFKMIQPSTNAKKTESSVTNAGDSSIDSESSNKSSSVSEIVKNLVIKTMAEKAVETSSRTGVSLTSSQVLSSAVVNISLEELKAKLPPKHHTSDTFKLGKFSRIPTKKISKVSKNGRLPMCHRFETGSHLKSILVLDRNELRKLARVGARRESQYFNYNCKTNAVCWPYPCPRPFFKTGWRYRTMTLSSLSAAALQLRILWACLRWDDMAAKPPAGGTNTVSTETEITTTELLKRREVGTDGLRSEFLVRKIVVPLGVPEKPKEKYTPQRSGLRERKRAEAVRQTEPSVTEIWVPEEALELWEIKQFGEKLEKQRQALQEKAKESGTSQPTPATSQQTAAQIKAQMEQQLKQQRLALAQKRIQESQGIKITTTSSSITSLSSSSSATTIIINNASSLGKPGATFKTLTVSSPSSLLSPGIIKTMQPKTVITNAGSLLGSQQIRPGIRVQLQGSSLQIRPQTVTLAPKPGTTVVTTSGVSTITRLISPNPATRIVSPAAPQGKTQTIQIKPQTAGQPVQNLQLIQQPGGQFQVKGFLPGQIIQRMPDGKLQIISLNTSTHASTSSTISSPVSSTSLQPQTRPAISIQPQQTIMVSIPGPTSSSSTVTQNRLVIPAQLASSVGLALSKQSSPTTVTIPSSRPLLGGTVISTTPQKHMIITRAGGQVISAQNIAAPAVTSPSLTGALNSAVIISAPSAVNASVGSNVTPVLVNSNQTASHLSSLSSPVVCVSGNQTLISTLRPVVASQSQSTTTTSVTTSLPTASLLSGQVVSGTSLLPRPGNTTSLLNISGTSGGTMTLPASSASQIPKILASPPVGAQIIRPLGSSQAQLVIRPGSTLLTGAGQAKVITAQQLKGLTSTPIQLKPATTLASPIKTMLSPQSSTLILPSTTKTTSAVRSLTTQLSMQTSSPQQASLLTAPKQTTTAPTVSLLQQGLAITTTESTPASGITSPTSVTSPSAGAGVPKYAITPQVVEQVVRQALLQNQTPEIQQKLLAMQRQIQQQRVIPASAAGVVAISGSSTSAQRITQSTVATSRIPSSSSSGSESRPSKSKGLTQEQKEEQSRNSICGQVMKSILDRIEREEKQEQRNKKKLESAEEKQKRLAVINQQKALFKHKEALKKEILRKRSLMEKNLQQEIYNEMAEKVKKAKMAASPSKSPHASSVVVSPTTSVAATSKKSVKQAETPKAIQTNLESKGAAKKRKQKIISTGVKSLNPKEKLYCVCKTPYDDSKFYIGCDLCSNWFHGSCVNISEDQAKFIDSYICEDCRKQQENTSEELYCLCRTPYDENQFYIGCDRCQDWFHGYCVGISKNEADSIDVYLCPNCQKEETADPIAQRQLTSSEYQHLTKLLKDLKVHKMAWPFLQPVDPREVPDYYKVIMEPMDLTIIEEKLSARSYEKLNDFVKDVTKIFDNCRFYNPVGTPYYQCAEVVETYFAQRIKALRGAHKL